MPLHLSGQAERLRIYTGESDRLNGRPLHEVILEEARRAGMAGGTIIRAVAGFGANSRVHTAKILRLSEDLPMITEIVDTTPNIDAFLPVLDELMTEGLVVREPVRVLVYRAKNGEELPDDGGDAA